MRRIRNGTGTNPKCVDPVPEGIGKVIPGSAFGVKGRTTGIGKSMGRDPEAAVAAVVAVMVAPECPRAQVQGGREAAGETPGVRENGAIEGHRGTRWEEVLVMLVGGEITK